MHVRNPAISPPNQWRYVQPETGQTFKSPSLSLIAASIQAHRVGNELELGDIQADVHEFTCKLLIDEGHADLVNMDGKLNRSIVQYWRGLHGLALIQDRLARNMPVFVSEELATKRAEICASCGYNDVMGRRNVPMEQADKVAGRIGGRTTKLDSKLGTCVQCSCRCRSIVWYERSLLAESMGDSVDDLPDNCWKVATIKEQ